MANQQKGVCQQKREQNDRERTKFRLIIVGLHRRDILPSHALILNLARYPHTVAANMEGTTTTEPILAILGHPIAGNPSQFAIERALREMELDWRVLSFDVSVDNIPTALEGFHVLGIRGVLVDPSVSHAVARWARGKMLTVSPEEAASTDQPSEPTETSSDLNVQNDSKHASDNEASDVSLGEADTSTLPTVDCLYRDEHGQFRASCELANWLSLTITKIDASGVTHDPDESSAWVWIGEPDQEAIPICAIPRGKVISLPPDPNTLENATFIVIFDQRELELEDWPRDDGSTIIIDLTPGHPNRQQLEALGYRVIDEMERRLATLCGCLMRWSEKDAPREVISDALEEYLGV